MAHVGRCKKPRLRQKGKKIAISCTCHSAFGHKSDLYGGCAKPAGPEVELRLVMLGAEAGLTVSNDALPATPPTCVGVAVQCVAPLRLIRDQKATESGAGAFYRRTSVPALWFSPSNWSHSVL